MVREEATGAGNEAETLAQPNEQLVQPVGPGRAMKNEVSWDSEGDETGANFVTKPKKKKYTKGKRGGVRHNKKFKQPSTAVDSSFDNQ